MNETICYLTLSFLNYIIFQYSRLMGKVVSKYIYYLSLFHFHISLLFRQYCNTIIANIKNQINFISVTDNTGKSSNKIKDKYRIQNHLKIQEIKWKN